MGWLDFLGKFHLAAPLFLLFGLGFFLFLIPFFGRKKKGWLHSNLNWLKAGVKKVFVPVLMFFLAIFATAALVFSAAQPKMTAFEKSEMIGKDIMAVIDISGSMIMEVGGKTKLEVARESFFNFVRERPKDRIALMLFSHDPYVLRFFTSPSEHHLVLEGTLLNDDIKDKESKLLGFAGGTNIAKALKTAHEIFSKSSKAEGKVIILITDLEEGGYYYSDDPSNEVLFREMENILVDNIRIYVVGVDVEEKMKNETIRRFSGLKNFYYFDVSEIEDYSTAFTGIDRMEDSIVQVSNILVKKDIGRFFVAAAAAMIFSWIILRLFWLIKIP